jgi:hypothetical protein
MVVTIQLVPSGDDFADGVVALVGNKEVAGTVQGHAGGAEKKGGGIGAIEKTARAAADGVESEVLGGKGQGQQPARPEARGQKDGFGFH